MFQHIGEAVDRNPPPVVPESAAKDKKESHFATGLAIKESDYEHYQGIPQQ